LHPVDWSVCNIAPPIICSAAILSFQNQCRPGNEIVPPARRDVCSLYRWRFMARRRVFCIASHRTALALAAVDLLIGLCCHVGWMLFETLPCHAAWKTLEGFATSARCEMIGRLALALPMGTVAGHRRAALKTERSHKHAPSCWSADAMSLLDRIPTSLKMNRVYYCQGQSLVGEAQCANSVLLNE